MKIYFVRHGLAENRHEWYPQDDSLRPLTEEGVAKMRASAQTMRRLNVRPDLILTSPLIRARQSADIVGGTLGVEVIEHEALGLDFGLYELAEIVRTYPDAEDLMVVGHEPDFSITVETLIGGGRVVVKKGSLIRVDVIARDPLRGELAWMIPPKLLAL